VLGAQGVRTLGVFEPNEVLLSAGYERAKNTENLRENIINSVMNEYYGAFNQQSNCWIAKRMNATYCMNLHKVDAVDVAGEQRLFVVVAGKTLGDDGTPNEYHAAPGILGLLILASHDGRVDLIAKNNLFEEIGSYGAVPPKASFTVEELGPQSYGWTIVEEGFSSGTDYKASYIYAPLGKTITSIGHIFTFERQNEGAGCEKVCSDYSIEVLIDQNAQATRFYPLILRTSGTKSGQPFNKTYRAYFNDSIFKYVLPSEIDMAAAQSPTSLETGDSSFHATRPEPLAKVTNLECVVERETSVDTRDPISKIAVRLTLDDDMNVQDLTVVHHARSGAEYSRANQYVGAQLGQVPGHTEYSWTGALIRNPSKIMKGRLLRTTDKRWAYIEQLLVNGRQDYAMESVCHNVGSDSRATAQAGRVNSPTARPSFACEAVNRCPENAICNNSELAKLDSELADLYYKMKSSSTSLSSKSLLDSQVMWLKARKGCGCDADCLLALYSGRLAKLREGAPPTQEVAAEGCKAIAIDSNETATREIDGIVVAGIKKGEIVTGLKTYSENSKMEDYLYCTFYGDQDGVCYQAKALRLLNCRAIDPIKSDDEGGSTRVDYKLVPAR
jgi:uncharacterized protein